MCCALVPFVAVDTAKHENVTVIIITCISKLNNNLIVIALMGNINKILKIFTDTDTFHIYIYWYFSNISACCKV